MNHRSQAISLARKAINSMSNRHDGATLIKVLDKARDNNFSKEINKECRDLARSIKWNNWREDPVNPNDGAIALVVQRSLIDDEIITLESTKRALDHVTVKQGF